MILDLDIEASIHYFDIVFIQLDFSKKPLNVVLIVGEIFQEPFVGLHGLLV